MPSWKTGRAQLCDRLNAKVLMFSNAADVE
jgi:hypothetical protein